MTVDPSTAMLSAVIVTAVAGAVLAGTTALRHDTPAGRSWTAAFVAIGTVQFLTLAQAEVGVDPRLTDMVLAAGLVFAFGSLWTGFRELEDRPGRLGLVVAAAGLAAAASLPDLRVADGDVDVLVAVLVAAGFATVAARELRSGRMRSNVNAQALQLLLIGFAVVGPARGLLVATTGGRTDRSDAVAAIAFAALFTAMGLFLVALRTEQTQSWWTSRGEYVVRSEYTVLNREAFRSDARDRIDRTAGTDLPVGVVWVELTQVDDLDDAFGRAVGDLAIVHVAGVIRDQVPPFAVIGHYGGGRFAVLTAARARRPIARVRSAIVTGLSTRPWPAELPLRVPCRIGVAVAAAGNADLDTLLAVARADAAVAPAT